MKDAPFFHVIAPVGAIWRRNEMKKVTWVALLLLALSAGAVQAQESPGAHLGGSWSANVWATLVDLMTAIFAPDPAPTSPPAIMGGDCGAGMDPTGGCRG